MSARLPKHYHIAVDTSKFEGSREELDVLMMALETTVQEAAEQADMPITTHLYDDEGHEI